MLLYVEEIRALQVRISLRLPGVDGIRVDGGPNCGFGDVIFITFQDAGDRSEFSQHIRDHQVLDLELRRGVNAIDNRASFTSLRRWPLKKGNHRSSFARTPRTGVRTIGCRREVN